MDYINEICNGCNQPLKEGDDIVVCPDCGTPQHRSCWNEAGQCVNSSLHSEGFVWKKSISEPEVKEEIKNEPEQNDEPSTGVSPVFVQLTNEAQNMESVFLRDQMLYKDEEIDGVSVIDAGYYLQSGANKYIKRFRKNKKLTWNWGAFFFAPAWFFYRKLYKAGAVFLALVTAIGLFTFSFSQDLIKQVDEMYASTEAVTSDGTLTPEAAQELVEDPEFMGQYVSVLKGMMLFILIKLLIPNTIAALTGDFFVKKKMKDDISSVKASASDSRTQRALIISKGGVAPFIFAIVYFINRYLVSILMSIGTMVAELFN